MAFVHPQLRENCFQDDLLRCLLVLCYTFRGQAGFVAQTTGATGTGLSGHKEALASELAAKERFSVATCLPPSSPYGLLDPHPTVVATKLLARKKFVDNGKQFNMIACSLDTIHDS
ncbi:alpha dioxygenase [Melia azedarach]|uniref:Alpha dioxygenase n=1 Tax=Melia azedarach TaxID=155640 RepID=A0ACC1XQK9_MELAZ|nr:alpha dioxygenase [Melia azedarach]